MQEADVAALVRRSYQAFLAGDKEALDDIFSDDFAFTSPRDHRLDREGFYTRCLPGAISFRDHYIEKLFIQGDEAFVLYTVELRDGTKFRNTEHVHVENNRIKSVEVYFGEVEPYLGPPRLDRPDTR